jgi:hypothetical protein
MTMKRLFFLSTITFYLLLLSGCSGQKKRYVPEVPASDLPSVEIKIKRYGQALFSLDTNNLVPGLKSIKDEYLLFLDTDLDKEENIAPLKKFLSDSINRMLFQKVEEKFHDLKPLENSLASAYSHYLYYFPEESVPSFYSYISGVYYEEPVMVYDTFALIGLDNYLGRNCRYYDRLMIPKYKSRWMIKQEIVPDVISTLYYQKVRKNYKPNNLLDMMIFSGKKMFFLDAMMPDMPDTLKIRYTQKQLQWVEANEKNIWAFLISEKLLFSADFKQVNKLMQDGPFTNGFSREAPSRLGEWIGWQIVSRYMENNPEITLSQLLNESNAQKILRQSGYKP